MKLAKLLLICIGSLAIAGGVLAFKTRTFLPRNGVSSYLTTRNGSPTILCTTANFVLTDFGVLATTYTTILLNHECPPTVVTLTVPVD